MMGLIGKIIEPPKANIREHERRTAQALARHGCTVEFIVKTEISHTKSADVFINGIKWEIKSPQSSKLRQIEFNIKVAYGQSPYIIIDSQRIKSTPDEKILTFLRHQINRQPKAIRGLLFINKRREIIDVKALLDVK